MATSPRRRVSLKGKGADIFFGDYAPSGNEKPEEVATGTVLSDTEREATPAPPEQESLHASKNASKQASKKASKLASTKSERRVAPSDGAIREDAAVYGSVPDAGEADSDLTVTPSVWASIETPATITSSFRYTDDELSELADVVYEISKHQKARLTKQDVARLGLNLVLDDYRRRGASSLLGQLAGRRQPQRSKGG